MDPELTRRIQELIDYKGGGFNQENVADIIENALKQGLGAMLNSASPKTVKPETRPLDLSVSERSSSLSGQYLYLVASR